MREFPKVAIDTEFVPFGGGIDAVTPALLKKNGFCLDAVNYEPGVNGGYPRIDAYERFDGRPSPSAATYYTATITLSGTVLVGHSIKGSTSGATATVSAISGGAVQLTKVVSTFVVGETITRGGSGGLLLLLGLLNPTVTVGTLATALTQAGAASVYLDAVALNAAADIYRADIGAVPGGGNVLGSHVYKGVTYAFRNNHQGTAAHLWKSSSTGWAHVPLGYEVRFSNGSIEIKVDETLYGASSTKGGVVRRVVLESGSWAAGTAAGRIILGINNEFINRGLIAGENMTSFTQADLDSGTFTYPTKAKAVATESAITILPNGRYEIVSANFYASEDTLRMYGADGVNRGFECDGTIFVPINTGMTEDKPVHCNVHKLQLFFTFRGSVQMSSRGLPYQWTPVTGAAELGIGDRVTALEAVTEDVLAMFARNRVDKLLGKTRSDFVQSDVSPKYGAIPYTVQNVGALFFLDDQGIRRLTPTQAYGSLNDVPVSQLVQPVIDLIRGRATASVVYRARQQYRVYGNDGSGVILGTMGGKVIGITSFQYPCVVNCAAAGEDSTGKDVVFLGATNGYVYQGDKGSSFDGEAIEAFIRPVFNHSRTPRIVKRYRKGILEMESRGYAEIRVSPEFSYGHQAIAEHRREVLVALGPGGYWDSAIYDTVVYDAQIVQNPEFSIEGSGLNVSLLCYSNSEIDLGHTIQGVMFHYTPRKLAR